MRIITVNVNGIRAAARKGFFTWLATQNADVVCLQETKAHVAQLSDPMFHPAGYHCYYHDAEKKGYSGVAVYTRTKPKHVQLGVGWPLADQEGRHLEVELENVWVISLYLPSGTSADARQAVKYQFMDYYVDVFNKIKRRRKPTIICGDWNIAHKAVDLKNWRGNQKNSGFLPEERAWMDKVLGEMEFIDAFREINQEPEQYTWWSNRGQAWANNVGWRIDYQVMTPHLRHTVKYAEIYKDQRFSDHAPLIIDYDKK
jgi:exodeoxyribonuclease III